MALSKNLLLNSAKTILSNLQPKKHLSLFLFLLLGLNSLAQPSISSFTPASGPLGTTVTINGSGFSSTPSNNIVFFGAVKATVFSASASSLTVQVPAGATYQPITVTTNNLTAYSAKPFVVTFSGGNDFVAANLSFDSPIDSTTDLHPNDVAMADFDGDGKVDLATANNYSISGQPASVSILRNTGSLRNISFAPRLDIATGTFTYGIAAADLNGDGKPDLISSSIADQKISIYKNTSTTGSISFATKIDYPSQESPYRIAVNDIDGDGKPDIVVANNIFSNTVSVFKNTSTNGNISFAPKIDLASNISPYSVTINDFDGDSKPDIAVCNEFSNTISVFRNTSTVGSISFAQAKDFTTGTTPKGITSGDIDGDGKTDIATANYGANSFSALRNISTIGNIVFEAKKDFSVGANPLSLSMGDLNGDGKPEIVVPSFNLAASQNTSTVGNINFANRMFFSPGINLNPNVVGIGDLDGDGKNDLAGAIFTSEKIKIYRNKNNEPGISSFSPTTASAGTTVTINGIGFSGTTAVSFGGMPATSFTAISNTAITAVVGSGVSGDISVTNAYGTGTKSGFSFAGPPVITSFTPTGTGVGNTVTITGANLNGATAVTFGGIAASSFTVVSPTTITAVVATGASGNVSVTTQYGTATAGGFSFLPTPTIASFTPLRAGADSNVTIIGTNFLTTNSVSFGNITASSFTVISNTQLKAIVGQGASGNVSVTNAYGTASVPGFVFIPAPQIASFSPTNGVTGTTVTIAGNNFNGVTEVNFGNVPANSFTITSNTLITAVVGTGGSGNITIKSPGGIGNINGFAFVPPPQIISFSPTEAKAGSTLTITGTNLKSLINDNKVTIGSVEASITSITDNTITVVVPEVTTNKPVSVIANRLVATSSQSFATIYPSTQDSFNTNSFKPFVFFKGGVDPFDLHTNDLDGDGKLDIISGDVGRKISILRNTSSKNAISFANKIEIEPFWIPHVIALGDLDGDGKNDIVAGNGGAAIMISVFLNKSTPGTISFASRIDYDAPRGFLNYLALGDMDGDGRLDMVVRPQGDTISVYLNKSTLGNIQFGKPVKFFVGAFSSFFNDVIIEDLDGDKKPEIINTTPTTVLFHNKSTPGNLSFSSPITICPASIQISVNDLDKDGKKDLAVLTTSWYKFFTYRNQSTPGNFAFVVDSVDIVSVAGVIESKDLKSGDLNGDGSPEIVTINHDAFLVFENKSTSGKIAFKAQKNYLRNPPDRGLGFGHLNIADINGDNKMEVNISKIGADTVFVFFNNSSVQDTVIACAGANTILLSSLSGTIYQWQVDVGNGFINLFNDMHYTGVNSSSLQLINIPFNFNNYKYRCLVDGNMSNILVISITQSLIPSVTTVTSANNICAGTFITFTATPTNGGTTPSYQWQVNNVNVGTNANTFTSATLNNNDQVKVIMTSNATCLTTPTATSTAITMIVNASTKLSGKASSPAQACGGTVYNVGFTSTNAPNGSSVQLWENSNNGPFTSGNTQTYNGSALNFPITNTSGGTKKYFFKITPPAGNTCIVANNSDTSTTVVDQVAKPIVAINAGSMSVTNSDATVSYKWQVQNGGNWTDVTPPANGISFTATQTGSYRVQANKGVCTEYSDAQSITVANSNSSNQNVLLYPNPTQGTLTLDSLKLSDNWEVLDIISLQSGQKVASFNITNQTKITVNLTTLSNGIYAAVLRRRDGSSISIDFVKM